MFIHFASCANNAHERDQIFTILCLVVRCLLWCSSIGMIASLVKEMKGCCIMVDEVSIFWQVWDFANVIPVTSAPHLAKCKVILATPRSSQTLFGREDAFCDDDYPSIDLPSGVYTRPLLGGRQCLHYLFDPGAAEAAAAVVHEIRPLSTSKSCRRTVWRLPIIIKEEIDWWTYTKFTWREISIFRYTAISFGE